MELIDVSGTATFSNPEIKRSVLARVAAGEITGVVVADLDRLFRADSPASYQILNVFHEMGATIYSGDSEYNLDTPDGLLHGTIRSAFSGYELSLMKRRQQGAKEARRRAGKCPSNHLTLPLGIGYDRKNDTWTYTAKIGLVKELFELYDGGVRCFGELKRRTGIHAATIRIILRNPIYTGWRIISQKRGQKRVSRNGKTYRVKVDRPDAEIIRCKVLDGIVSDECFERVQRELANTKFNFIERFRSDMRVNLCTSLAICGYCGEYLQVVSGKRDKQGKTGPGYYCCKSRHFLFKKRLGGCQQPHLKAEDLDNALLQFASGILSDPHTLARILEQSEDRARQTIVPFTQTHGTPDFDTELRKQEARLLDAFTNGIITLEEFKLKREGIRKEREALVKFNAPKKVRGNEEFLKMARIIVKAALRFRELKDRRQQKAILHELFSQIVVKDKAITSFKFRETALREPGTEANVQCSSVILSAPVPIGVIPESLPVGKRRCIKCEEVLGTDQFYRNLNSCNSCRKVSERARHLRRSQEKAVARVHLKESVSG